jgi:hypothetical protein
LARTVFGRRQLEKFNLDHQSQVTAATLRARPGCVLVAVRDYHRMHHLQRALEKTNLRRHDIVVMTVREANTLEPANAYLENEFVPWWNSTLTVLRANPTDAHRPLGPQHDLASALCQVHTRQVANDYTLQFRGQRYQIARADIRAGLRGANVPSGTQSPSSSGASSSSTF